MFARDFLKNKLITDTVSAVQILESDLKNFKPSQILPSFTKNANVLISSIDSISKTPEEFKKLSPSVFYYLYGMIYCRVIT